MGIFSSLGNSVGKTLGKAHAALKAESERAEAYMPQYRSWSTGKLMEEYSDIYDRKDLLRNQDSRSRYFAIRRILMEERHVDIKQLDEIVRIEVD